MRALHSIVTSEGVLRNSMRDVPLFFYTLIFLDSKFLKIML